MNTPVSFLIAKLLNEKGIIFETKLYYSSETKVTSVSYNEFAAPTIADVVMWIYEKHGIWIISVPEGLSTTWAFSLFNINPEKGRIIFNSPSFDSPTEAYEAAIEYTLNNLI